MAARRGQKKRGAGNKAVLRGRWWPFAFFGLVCLTAGFLVVAELQTYFAYPTADAVAHPDGVGSGRVWLYHKTGRARAGDVYFESGGGQLRWVAPIYYAGKDRGGAERERFGELRWTRDGGGIVALDETGERVMWLYDTGLDGRFLGPAAAHRYRLMGGAGRLIANWFDVGGRQGVERLRSWETTRFEEARKRATAVE